MVAERKRQVKTEKSERDLFASLVLEIKKRKKKKWRKRARLLALRPFSIQHKVT